MSDMIDGIPGYLHTAAVKMVERADVLRLKGKRADDEAVGFFAGYATALGAAGHAKEAAHVGMVLAYVISPRGMMEVRRLASRPVRPAEVAAAQGLMS